MSGLGEVATHVVFDALSSTTAQCRGHWSSVSQKFNYFTDLLEPVWEVSATINKHVIYHQLGSSSYIQSYLSPDKNWTRFNLFYLLICSSLGQEIY